MPPIDFDWREGDDAFAESRVEPTPLPEDAFARPQPGVLEADVASREHRGPSNWILLLIGVALGSVLGLGAIIYLGQVNARADLAPLVRLEGEAIANGDSDLFNSLMSAASRPLTDDDLAALSLLSDGPESTRVRWVRIRGDYAEMTVDIEYEGRAYRRVEAASLSEKGWLLTPVRPKSDDELQEASGEWVTLRYQRRDAFLRRYLPELDAVTEAFCLRYAPPEPCRIELRIVISPKNQPFLPAQGASPPPLLLRYRILGAGDTDYVTFNGTGEEMRNDAFSTLLLTNFPEINEIAKIYPARLSSTEAQEASLQRLYGQTMPLTFPSPRLAGVSGRKTHPLWRLSLYEAIGDVIMRRAVGPVTGEDKAVFTLWAVARGDVALWAERFAETSLPAAPIAAESDPARIGEALADRVSLSHRNAARSFTRSLYDCFGEQVVVDWFTQARDRMGQTALYEPLAASPDDLAEIWSRRMRGEGC